MGLRSGPRWYDKTRMRLTMYTRSAGLDRAEPGPWRQERTLTETEWRTAHDFDFEVGIPFRVNLRGGESRMLFVLVREDTDYDSLP